MKSLLKVDVKLLNTISCNEIQSIRPPQSTQNRPPVFYSRTTHLPKCNRWNVTDVYQTRGESPWTLNLQTVYLSDIMQILINRHPSASSHLHKNTHSWKRWHPLVKCNFDGTSRFWFDHPFTAEGIFVVTRPPWGQYHPTWGWIVASTRCWKRCRGHK